MLETHGTITLKIAQLEKQHGILQHRLVLSSPYPEIKDKLTQTNLHVEWQMQQLRQYQQLLGHQHSH